MASMNPQPLFLDALGHDTADKRMDILRLIGVTGSISEAARQAGISYKAAWQAIHTLTNLAGVALVDRAVGGAGGGGALLTPAGEQLLDAAAQMDAARGAVLARFTGGAAHALAGAGLRTSMRNNLPCVVTQIQVLEPGDPMVRVVMQLPLGAEIASTITRESAELLALRPGLPVLALCKATAVKVDAVAKTAARPPGDAPNEQLVNQLLGRVQTLSRGKLQDEAVLTLTSGLQLVGFARQPNRLRVGSLAAAHIEENAVVLARG